MSVPTPQEAQGLFALAFFLMLIIFVCFEVVQVARGKIHLAGIFRAALEILIVSPVIVLMIVLLNKVSDRFDLDWLEQRYLVKLVVIPALALIWAPWTHYRASQITKAEIVFAKHQNSMPSKGKRTVCIYWTLSYAH